jgi:hypothetical protein
MHLAISCLVTCKEVHIFHSEALHFMENGQQSEAERLPGQFLTMECSYNFKIYESHMVAHNTIQDQNGCCLDVVWEEVARGLLSLLCQHGKRDILICNEEYEESQSEGLFLTKVFCLKLWHLSVVSSDLLTGPDFQYFSANDGGDFIANKWKSEAKRMPGPFFTTESSHNYKFCSTCHGRNIR